MRTVALIALLVIIGVAQCGLVRRSKVEQSNFFDDVVNAFGNLFGKPANSWNSQGTHFNVTNHTNSSNLTNNTYNSQGWRFDEQAAATPEVPVVAEKPKGRVHKLKNKAKKHWNNRPWKKNAKKTEKTEKTEEANFFDDVVNAFGNLFGRPANSWNSQGTHFNVTNHTNSSNLTNSSYNSQGWRFEEETPATEAPVAAEKPKGRVHKLKNKAKKHWNNRPWKKNAKVAKKAEKTEEANFFDDVVNAFGNLFNKPANNWNSQGTHFNVTNHTNSSNLTNTTYNSQGWRFDEEEAPAVEAPKKKKRGFLGRVGGFFKGMWSKRPWAKKKQTETTTEESDVVPNTWNSAGYVYPQQQQTTWNSQGYTFPQQQPQTTWNSQGYTFPQQQPQNTWNSQGYVIQQQPRRWW